MPQFAITQDLENNSSLVANPANAEKVLAALGFPDLPSVGLDTGDARDRILLKEGEALLMSGKTKELTAAVDTVRPGGQGFIESELSRPQICVAGARRGRISKQTILVIFGVEPDQPSPTREGWMIQRFKSPMDLDLLMDVIKRL